MEENTELDIVNTALGLINEARISSVSLEALSGTERTVGQKILPFYDKARKQLLTLARWSFARVPVIIQVGWFENGGTQNNGGEAELYHVGHGLATGATVVVEGTGYYDGRWNITRVDADSITLDDSVFKGVGSAGKFAAAPPFGYRYQIDLPSDCLRVHTVDGVAAGMPSKFWRTIGKQLHYNAATAALVYCKDVTDISLFTPWFRSALTKRLAADYSPVLTNNVAMRNQYIQEVEQMDIPTARLQNEIDKDEQPFEQSSRYGGGFRDIQVSAEWVLDTPGGSL